MILPPVPDDEAERLQALRRLRVLDTAPEPRFDWLAAYAARELQAPVALVSLVDAQRQWFKARFGLALAHTPRTVSFCAHAIVRDDVMQVEDARRDERFADNPLVTGEPYIRFYAGAPLHSPEGRRLGTLCVIDTAPRRLTPAQQATLRSLADLAAWELSLGAAPQDGTP